MDSGKTFTYEEAFAASLEYFGGDELAARVWVNKYAMKDSFGNIYEKSPEDMLLGEIIYGGVGFQSDSYCPA